MALGPMCTPMYGLMYMRRFSLMMMEPMVRCVHFVAGRNHLFLSAVTVICIIAVTV